MNFVYLVLIWIVQTHCTRISTEYKQLNDGNWIPAASFGTFRINYPERANVAQSVLWAIEAGYRHFDTAPLYLTEDKVAEGIAEATSRGMVNREELFITTKLPFNIGRRSQVIPAVRQSLKRLRMDYVDLVIIHTPINVLGLKKFDYLDLWRGLEDAKRVGLVRSIGVSNFNSTQINRILLNSDTPPAVNEIETNPTFAEQELVAYCQQQGILVLGYAPFGFMVPRPFADIRLPPPTLDDPVLVKMARKYGVTTSQIVLRYLADRGIVPIAASANREHVRSNIDIFDFSLTLEEVRIINAFNINNIKVYYIDYEGMFRMMSTLYYEAEDFVYRNKLRKYYETYSMI